MRIEEHSGQVLLRAHGLQVFFASLAISKAYDSLEMAKINLAREAERLAALYAGMEEAQLADIAADASSLTDVARQVLRAEMTRRAMAPLLEHSAIEAKNEREPIPAPPIVLRRYRDLPEGSIAKSMRNASGVQPVRSVRIKVSLR